MRTEMNLNESEIDLNKCEDFLIVNLDPSEIDLSCINLCLNSPYEILTLLPLPELDLLRGEVGALIPPPTTPSLLWS